MDVSNVLEIIVPGAAWKVYGESYDDIVWLDDKIKKPTQDEVNAAWPSIERDYILKEARRHREDAYRKEADPLFFKYQAGEIPREDWEVKRAEIRDRYPYPED